MPTHGVLSLRRYEKLGIQTPFGCRMGICQSWLLPVESGYVRDLRCISAASGDCTIDI
jgi:hypothetical protein